MKLRWIVVIGFVALATLGAFFLWPSDNSKQKKAVKETRHALRQQGFKTDLADFNFFTSDELRAREVALGTRDHTFRPRPSSREFNFMTAVGSDAAIVLWKEEYIETYSNEDFWTGLRESLAKDQSSLDAACDAALSGPIGFNLNASAGNGMLLPHLAALKSLAQTFSSRAVLELHDNHEADAWKNLLALTRLVTAWQPESVEISQLVRFSCSAIAYNATWQMLQKKSWTDEQLTELQREWESPNFFNGLPETVAFARASAVAACQLERLQPLGGGFTVRDILQSPMSAWSNLRYSSRQRQYRKVGTYEDEKALLLYYRDREIEMARAVKSPNWFEMRQLPGVTSLLPFQSTHQSQMHVAMNLRQMSLRFSGQGQGLLAKATEAETRRRIILAAIALERHRARNGSYPKTLQELSPEFRKRPTIDFMDGQPLRYRFRRDGNFVLYSIGLDCVDNNGEMPLRKRPGEPYEVPPYFGNKQELDLVWPRPASANEADILIQSQIKEATEQMNQINGMQTDEWWRWTAKRQGGAEKLLTNSNSPVPEITYRGRLLSELLRNREMLGTNRVTLGELLTLRQIVTGEEPEIVTFEVPIAYDQLTNLADLQLCVDCTGDDDSDFGCCAWMVECKRGQNGNCLLVWRTIFEPPGKHALQLGLALKEPTQSDEDISGPFVPFTISNLCQVSISSDHFDPNLGAIIHAKLVESNGNYQIDLVSTNGERLKRFEGSTSNGEIKLHWNLKDDHGNKFTNSLFDSIFHITLPDSGRSQAMRGP